MKASFAFALAACLAAGRAGALEPRFDHRDQLGLLFESGYVRDTLNTGGGVSTTSLRPMARIGVSFDVSGEGDELAIGAVSRPSELGSSRAEALALALDARYRGYFGTEELKTFFDLGIWAPLVPRLAIGPRVGLGALYDFTRSAGLFASFGFATAFGQVRVASLELAAGAQVRW